MNGCCCAAAQWASAPADEERRERVVAAMRHAWSSYERICFGVASSDQPDSGVEQYEKSAHAYMWRLCVARPRKQSRRDVCL